MTDSTINDVEIGRQTELEAGATYVFDKGYYHFGWGEDQRYQGFLRHTRQGEHPLAQDEVPVRAARS